MFLGCWWLDPRFLGRSECWRSRHALELDEEKDEVETGSYPKKIVALKPQNMATKMGKLMLMMMMMMMMMMMINA